MSLKPGTLWSQVPYEVCGRDARTRRAWTVERFHTIEEVRACRDRNRQEQPGYEFGILELPNKNPNDVE